MAQALQVIELLTDTNGSPVNKEALSATGSAIVPGMLVEETSAGEVQEHSTAAGAAQNAYALTNLPVAGTIDDAYTAGVTCRYGVFSSGQGVNALVAAGATAIPAGSEVESAGDGTVRVLAAGEILGYAQAAVDNSGGGTTARIQITIA